MMENLTKGFDLLFHWAGVWLVMNGITEAGRRFLDWLQVRQLTRTAERLGRGARRLTISLQGEVETKDDAEATDDGQDPEQEQDPEKAEPGTGDE